MATSEMVALLGSADPIPSEDYHPMTAKNGPIPDCPQ